MVHLLKSNGDNGTVCNCLISTLAGTNSQCNL
jgi:hypothetical protein